MLHAAEYLTALLVVLRLWWRKEPVQRVEWTSQQEEPRAISTTHDRKAPRAFWRRGDTDAPQAAN